MCGSGLSHTSLRTAKPCSLVVDALGAGDGSGQVSDMCRADSPGPAMDKLDVAGPV